MYTPHSLTTISESLAFLCIGSYYNVQLDSIQLVYKWLDRMNVYDDSNKN